MAWTFVGISNVVEVTGTSHALVTTGISGTLAAGDLLVACISSRIASATSVTLPTGGEWTLVAEQKTSNTTASTLGIASGLMAYCIRGFTNPNLTFTHPVAPSVALGRIVAYRNVNTSSPKDTQTSFTTATATTAVSGTGLTTTQIEDLIVAMAAGGQEAAWSAFNATTPSGASSTASQTGAPTTTWLERADSLTTTGADTSLAIFDAIKTTAGATGNLTATASIGGGHVVIAGAFKITARLDDAWNVDDKTATITLSNSDKTATISSSGSAGVRSSKQHTGGTAGKYYAEFLAGTHVGIVRLGIKSASAAVNDIVSTSEAVHVASNSGSIVNGASSIGSIGATYTAGDVICLAWNTGAERIWFRKNNGLWNNDAAADPATGTNGLDISTAPNTAHSLWYHCSTSGNIATLRTESAEFTQSPLPSGFTSWMDEALSAGGSVGDAAGVGAATGAGASTVAAPGIGAATGATNADGASTVTAAGAGTATGATGADGIASSPGVGSASGAGAAAAVGTGIASLRTVVSWVELSGTSSGVSYTSGAGAAAGTGVASAVGASTDAVVGAASGVGATSATGAKTAAALGSTALWFGVNSLTFKYLDGVEAVNFSQSFTATSGILTRASLLTDSGSSPVGNITVKVYLADGSHFPTGAQIGSTITITASSLPETPTLTDLVFPTPISLSVGTEYCLVVSRTSGGGGLVFTYVDTANPYAGGVLTATDSGGVWSGIAFGAWDAVGCLYFANTASAVGSAETAVSADGAASGVGAASATGAQTAAATAAASGSGATLATSIAGVAVSAAGIGAASGVGLSTPAAVGAASGTGAAQAVGTQTAAAVGAASGVGSASATSIAGVAGSSAGVGAAAATGASTFAAVGTAAGEGLLVGDSGGLAFGAGDAVGIGAASATGRATISAVGASAGTGTAQATGTKTSAGVGAASAVGTATAVGASEGGEEVIVSGVGNAAGVGEADGRSLEEQLPIAGGGGVRFRFRPRPVVIEGVGYGVLPELVGFAIGEVGYRPKLIAGRAKGVVALTGYCVCDVGVKGAAYSIARLPLMASASMDAGSAGRAEVNLKICTGVAWGNRDPDEHVVIALMMMAA